MFLIPSVVTLWVPFVSLISILKESCHNFRYLLNFLFEVSFETFLLDLFHVYIYSRNLISMDLHPQLSLLRFKTLILNSGQESSYNLTVVVLTRVVSVWNFSIFMRGVHFTKNNFKFFVLNFKEKSVTRVPIRSRKWKKNGFPFLLYRHRNA